MHENFNNVFSKQKDLRLNASQINKWWYGLFGQSQHKPRKLFPGSTLPSSWLFNRYHMNKYHMLTCTRPVLNLKRGKIEPWIFWKQSFYLFCLKIGSGRPDALLTGDDCLSLMPDQWRGINYKLNQSFSTSKNSHLAEPGNSINQSFNSSRDVHCRMKCLSQKRKNVREIEIGR